MSSCGSRSHPWRLEAPLGQRINVSLLDFSDTSRDHDVTCLQYGYILQKSSKKNASICASSVANRVDLHREIALYTSDDNRADIVLVNGENNFLLKVNGEFVK